MFSSQTPVVVALLALATGCSSSWPFGNVCNQEYRITFAYNLSQAEAKICDATSTEWDNDLYPGFVDYNDLQDEVDMIEGFAFFVPPEISYWVFDDWRIGACTTRNAYWEVLDWAEQEPWVTADFNENDLWRAGEEEWIPHWSD